MLHISRSSVPNVAFVKYLICLSVLKLFLLPVTGSKFSQISHDPNDVSFYLFLPPSGDGSREEIKYLDDSSLDESEFIPNALTVMFIHGYADTVDDNETTLPIMDAYLSSEIRANFIAVGWSKLSTPPGPLTPVNFVTGYLEVLPNLPIVGKRVAEFICWLGEKGVLKFSDVHLIGHSLGAHVAGDAGAVLQKLGGEKIGRITGLDPAGPLLEWPIKLEKVLNKKNAKFVDAIHTSAWLYGDIETNGDVDIYVNNGVVQPGCWSLDVIETINCSHEFAIRVYLAGFYKRKVACKCSLWRLYLGQCKDNPCIEPVIVGPYTKKSARGVFHLRTSANP